MMDARGASWLISKRRTRIGTTLPTRAVSPMNTAPMRSAWNATRLPGRCFWRRSVCIHPLTTSSGSSTPPVPAIFQVQTMREALYTLNGLLLFQIGASLAAIMGGLGLTLAVIGLYGVVSYAVSRRIHEIGLREAPGPTPGCGFRMVYRPASLVVAGGVGCGRAGIASCHA